MTRFVPEHFNPGGKPKRGFTTKKAAEDWLIDRGLWDKFEIYHCEFCGKWHLASVRTDSLNGH